MAALAGQLGLPDELCGPNPNYHLAGNSVATPVLVSPVMANVSTAAFSSPVK